MPITYVFLMWNLIANGVPLLSALGSPPHQRSSTGCTRERAGGVLALHAAASRDGRDLSVEYSPWLSGFGVTGASSQDGTLAAEHNVREMLTRTTSKDRTALATFLKARVRSINLPAWLEERGITKLKLLKIDCAMPHRRRPPRARLKYCIQRARGLGLTLSICPD